MADLNNQLWDNERYFSNDCVKLKNLPYDARKNGGYVKYSVNFLGFQHIIESRLKPYDIMPCFDSLPNDSMPCHR